MLLRICQACSSPANTRQSTFILVQNLPPPVLFLCLSRPCKSFTALTQFLPYIYKGLRPLAGGGHSPWSHLSLSPRSTFITLQLPVNDLPNSGRALAVSLGARTARSQSCSGLDFPDFLVSHSDLLALRYTSACSSSSVQRIIGCVRRALDMNCGTCKCKVGSSSCGWRSADHWCGVLGVWPV